MTHATDARTNYITQPTIPLPAGSTIWTGDDAWGHLADAASASAASVIAIDTYPGVDLPQMLATLQRAMPTFTIVNVEERAALPIEAIDGLIGRNLTEDRVFGVLSNYALDEFYDAQALLDLGAEIASSGQPTIVVGWGATLAVSDADIVVLADLARWEIQRRQRAGAPNWRCDNGSEDDLRKYKRGFFVEWRTADQHKRTFLDRVDFLLDTNRGIEEAALITGDSFRLALQTAATKPFRVVPFFDPGVWGGQWMKQKIGLDPASENYAWCFDCVPEENSLLLERDGRVVEIPAMDLVLSQPRTLLGDRTFSRFGAEFPIRFDLLDTMGGGNLSLQVHPLTDYMQRTFGMHYTQDESYYLLDADESAVVYLGLKTGTDPHELESALRQASDGQHPFPADEFVNRFPAKKHDHFAIPAGTVHCSGANSMVLEISATPFIFTFKLWDWDRLGLDGVPRPVHIDHGVKNIQWERDTTWVEDNLLDTVELICESEDVTEERTGLHALEFIEVRRHWFSEEAAHDTDGTVNVLNLVEGDEVEVVSPSGAFEPYVVHYAETFIVPAAVGPYSIRRTKNSASERFATVKAYVRGTRTSDE
ncbi:class I mannose-6-phosphate isomerase [Rathayibacter soli]|uniref:class I mannose-6-phosphate isomerase n=1 Tax=Rathayibacter soli TaxID=3144168 RepID=UPI0027E54F61|nr:class I mannose-6-phosphate isomerase [Glaciibacter superstes]